MDFLAFFESGSPEAATAAARDEQERTIAQSARALILFMRGNINPLYVMLEKNPPHLSSSPPATSFEPFERSWTWKGTLSPFISGWRRRNSLATGSAPG